MRRAGLFLKVLGWPGAPVLVGAVALLGACDDGAPHSRPAVNSQPGGDDDSARGDDETATDDDTTPLVDDDTTPAPDDDTTPVADDDTTPVADDDTTPVADDDTTPPPPDPEVCYPGAASDWEQCLSVVPASGISDPEGDYTYGNPSESPDSAWYPRPDRYIDILAWSEDLDLAPHFVLSEFLQSSKGRHGLLSPDVVALMEEIRVGRGEALYVTSGYRSPGYNAGLDGAATWSRHMYGDAVDFYMAGTSIEELEDDCLELGAWYTALYDDGHVHCDWRHLALDPAFFDPSAALGPGSAEAWPSAAWLEPGPPGRAERTGRPVERRIVWSGLDEGNPSIRWTASAGSCAARISGEGAEVAWVPPCGGPWRVQAAVGGRAAWIDEDVYIQP